MKKIAAIICTLCLVFAFESKAQTTPSWPAGPMTVTSVTATTKVPTYSVTPTNLAYLINIAVDTSLVIKAYPSTYNLKKGSILYVVVTNSANGATRTITGSTNVTMQSFTMTSAKTHMLMFVYDGTNYVNVSKFLVN